MKDAYAFFTLPTALLIKREKFTPMKSILPILICCGVIGLSCSADAGKPEKPATTKPGPAPTAPPDAPPSIQLEMFLNGYLDKILAPANEKGLKHPEFITKLHENLANAMTQAAEAKKPAYQAALKLCDKLSLAVEERKKVLAQNGDWDQTADSLRRDIMQFTTRVRELEQQGDTATVSPSQINPIVPPPVPENSPAPSSILSEAYTSPDPYVILTSGNAAQREAAQQKIYHLKQKLLDAVAKKPGYLSEAFKTAVEICDKFIVAFDQQNRNHLYFAQLKNEQGVRDQTRNAAEIQWAQKVDVLRQQNRLLDQKVRDIERSSGK